MANVGLFGDFQYRGNIYGVGVFGVPFEVKRMELRAVLRWGGYRRVWRNGLIEGWSNGGNHHGDWFICVVMMRSIVRVLIQRRLEGYGFYVLDYRFSDGVDWGKCKAYVTGLCRWERDVGYVGVRAKRKYYKTMGYVYK